MMRVREKKKGEYIIIIIIISYNMSTNGPAEIHCVDLRKRGN